MSTKLQSEIMRYALAVQAREHNCPLVIDGLIRAAGLMIAGAAKPGREASLVARAIELLKLYVDEAHAIAEADGVRLDGRAH
jgi:hypothetical protein